MKLPKRLGWLKSGRFLRLLSALVALVLLAGLLYNAIMVDRVAPTYKIQVSSTTGNGLAMTLTSIDVTFSEAVRPDTAERAFSVTSDTGSSPVAGTFHWQGAELIFTPSAKLALSTKFHARVAPGVQDLAGNAQGGAADVAFTTVGAPTVASVLPGSGAESVAVDASIQITFDRLMDTEKVIQGLSLKPDITYQASWNLNVLTLSPTRPMEYGTTYAVEIGEPAVDTDGTKLAPYSSIFKTVGVGLRVTALVPAPSVAGVSVHSQIAVTFDSPLDPSSIADALKITPPVSGSIKAISLPDDRNPPNQATATPVGSGANVLVFTPDNPLSAHTTYTVTMGSTVKRADGQVASAETWSFTTGEPPANALNEIAFTSDRGGVDNVWLMNFDGSNGRQVTSELVPVSGFDISGDGTTIAYSSGGVVKKMSVSGDNLTTLTSGGNLEYSPTITPDGTGLIVGRRDASGADMGYWRYPLVSGSGVEQVVPDGAPGLGSVTLGGDGLTGQPGLPTWAPRAAFTSDGTTMLLVRGADNAVEIVDMSGTIKPNTLGLQANSRPVWVQSEGAFFLAASDDKGATWSCWRVTPAGVATKLGSATGDVATNGRGLALIVNANDGVYHLAYAALGSKLQPLLVNDPTFNESAPSFSPDGSVVAFGRVDSQTPGVSAGIWIVKVDGTGLTNLSTDGAYPRWVP